MFRSIPSRILTHSATLRYPNWSNAYGETEFEEIELSRVCFQTMQNVVKSRDDKEIKLNGILFFDKKLSQPSTLDWHQIQENVEAENSQVKIEYKGRTYTVYAVDFLIDDEGNEHHLELSLV